MYKKLCSKCHQPSFSSCESGKWICPVCQNDLKYIFHQDAEARPNKPQLKLIVNRLSEHSNPKFLHQPTLNKYV
jgi:uncharacterized Zn finger protein (UPF0148 family)